MQEGDSTLAGVPLGRPVVPPDRYAPEVLYRVARGEARRAAGLPEHVPFRGVDLWTAYELSWLDPRGKPVAAVAVAVVPADSPFLVESKSLKLYLGSFAQTRHAGWAAVREIVTGDLARACGREVEVRLVLPRRFVALAIRQWEGTSIDGLDVACDRYLPDPALLATASSPEIVQETLRSDLLRTNCPVTGQPDWGSIQISYRGRQLDRRALLRYLVSYRQHLGFHEACIERIWWDIKRICAPARLTVYGRYLRRGGVDINPFRSDAAQRPAKPVRLPRQ